MKFKTFPTIFFSFGGQPGTLITGLFVILLSGTAFVGFGLAACIPPKLEQVPIAKIAAAFSLATRAL